MGDLRWEERIYLGSGGSFATPVGLAHSTVAESALITNTTDETVFSTGTYAIPANALAIGSVVKFWCAGTAPSTFDVDTLTLRVRINGLTTSIIGAVTPIDVADNAVFVISGECVVRSAGATGTLIASSIGSLGANGSYTAAPVTLIATQPVVTTGTNTLSVTAQWSNANAGNTVRLDMLNVTIATKTPA